MICDRCKNRIKTDGQEFWVRFQVEAEEITLCESCKKELFGWIYAPLRQKGL